MAVLDMHNKVTKSLDEGKFTTGVSIDLSTSFVTLANRGTVGRKTVGRKKEQQDEKRLRANVSLDYF